MIIIDYYNKYENSKMDPSDSVFIMNTDYHEVGDVVSFHGHNYHLNQKIAQYNLYR